MEERSSWLPPGLESSGLEPDDRAAQTRGRKRGKASERPLRAWRPEPPPDSEPQEPEAKADGGGRRRSWKREEEPEQQQSPREQPSQQERPRERGEKHAEQGGKQPPTRERKRGDHQASDVDAMGQDKHRKVIGQRYGASRARQFLYYGIFVAFLVACYIGLSAAVAHFDKKPAHFPAEAPWSKAGAPQGPLGGFEPKAPHQKGPTHFQ